MTKALAIFVAFFVPFGNNYTGASTIFIQIAIANFYD